MNRNMATARKRQSIVRGFTLHDALTSTAEDRRVAKAVERGLERVEEVLYEQVASTNELAETTSRYLLEAGGKRVRPMLTLLVSHLGSGIDEGVVKAAAAVEVTHLGSLYHDDVMDEATKRRGVDAAHVRWSNSIAIIAGDVLFGRSSRMFAELGEDALRVSLDTFDRLVLGQLNETIGAGPDADDAISYYIQVLSDKTGSLISACTKLGVLLSGADRAYIDPLVAYGENVGIAFQLIDDVIDLSPGEVTGKQAGTDLRAGVDTLPLLLLRHAAEGRALPERARLRGEASGAIADSDEALALLERFEASRASAAELAEPEASSPEFAAAVEVLRAHPVTELTRRLALQYAEEAVDALDGIPDGAVKKALIRFASSVVERDR